MTDRVRGPGSGLVRLRLSRHAGQGLLDGAWWPRDDDLHGELGLLLTVLPTEALPLSRVTYSPADWRPVLPANLTVDGFPVTVGRFARRDTHLVVLRSLGRRTYTLLVVPPLFSAEQGAEALRAALTFRNAYAARGLLRAVTEQFPDGGGHRWTT